MLQGPLQISFRNMEPSPAIEEKIRKKVEHLQKFYHRLIGCHVMIEAPHRHHHQGKIYHVRIEATLPGAEEAEVWEPEPGVVYSWGGEGA